MCAWGNAQGDGLPKLEVPSETEIGGPARIWPPWEEMGGDAPSPTTTDVHSAGRVSAPVCMYCRQLEHGHSWGQHMQF